MKTLEKQIIKILEALLVFSVGFMALLVIYQVVTRWCNIPSKFSEEIATILMIWIGTFGAAIGFQRGSHLGIDILMHCVNKPSQKMMHLITLVLVLIFAVLIWMYGGFLITLETFQGHNMLKTIPFISRGWVYLPIPMSGLFVAFFTLIQIKDACQPLASPNNESREVNHG